VTGPLRRRVRRWRRPLRHGRLRRCFSRATRRTCAVPKVTCAQRPHAYQEDDFLSLARVANAGAPLRGALWQADSLTLHTRWVLPLPRTTGDGSPRPVAHRRRTAPQGADGHRQKGWHRSTAPDGGSSVADPVCTPASRTFGRRQEHEAVLAAAGGVRWCCLLLLVSISLQLAGAPHHHTPPLPTPSLPPSPRPTSSTHGIIQRGMRLHYAAALGSTLRPVIFSYISRILSAMSTWHRPVPLEEPGALGFLSSCWVISP